MIALLAISMGLNLVLKLGRDTSLIPVKERGGALAGRPARQTMLPAASAESEIPGPVAQSPPASVDFFSALSLAFQDDDSHIELEVGSQKEEILFHDWKRAATVSGQTKGLILVRLERHPDGTDCYELSIEDARVRGQLRVEPSDGRWHIVGIEVSEGPAQKAAERAETRNLLDLIKDRPDKDAKP
jgi:hypothetical protein